MLPQHYVHTTSGGERKYPLPTVPVGFDVCVCGPGFELHERHKAVKMAVVQSRSGQERVLRALYQIVAAGQGEQVSLEGRSATLEVQSQPTVHIYRKETDCTVIVERQVRVARH